MLLTSSQIRRKYGIHENTLRYWRVHGCPFKFSLKKQCYLYDPAEVKEWHKKWKGGVFIWY